MAEYDFCRPHGLEGPSLNTAVRQNSIWDRVFGRCPASRLDFTELASGLLVMSNLDPAEEEVLKRAVLEEGSYFDWGQRLYMVMQLKEEPSRLSSLALFRRQGQVMLDRDGQIQPDQSIPSGRVESIADSVHLVGASLIRRHGEEIGTGGSRLNEKKVRELAATSIRMAGEISEVVIDHLWPEETLTTADLQAEVTSKMALSVV